MEPSHIPPSKARVEASKDRLVAAFRHLEQVINARIKKAGAAQPAMPEDGATPQTEALASSLQELTTNYNHLKEVSTGVLKQLNVSIHTIETLLKDKPKN
jgi:hypothetical protein